MSINIRLGTLVVAASAIAFAVPATAHPGPRDHRGGSDHAGAHHRSEHRRACAPHSVAYIESGVVDAATPSTLAQNADGTWSGTLVVDVTEANHWAAADKGTTVTDTFTAAALRVRFDGGTTAFTAGERVRLIGALAAVGRRCTAPSPAPAPVFRAVVVHPSTPLAS